ncbi:cytochrome-c peroxidase [Corallococcus praedator]|uniref:Cytochrome-c peroxidase n=1 Tax=Corallococcus praedator TaxID=2316724 RepID=A0ABX9QQJ0_9BACT|nr:MULTISPECIES: cytochrome-c peroxidase [Corallococcus]RKH33359.1 cytochrome-c peroxidase [Corallococcus sp. CA031C]RKI16236.1 cytochrome-c peroxidase [Corallococcus praedator]
MAGRRFIACTVGVFVLAGCTETGAFVEASPEPVTSQAELVSPALALAGKQHFQEALPGTNGRSCATCHVLSDDTALMPAHVEAVWAKNPGDPLFNRIDADDPTAPVPTYAHLKKGLVRVVLPLPPNMDVIDVQGNVITSPDRRISVWRGVPSIADTGFPGPFQFDGRETSLTDQVQSAVTNHSEGGTVPGPVRQRIAAFERSVFSSPRARFVSDLLQLGLPLSDIPDPDALLVLDAGERRGRDVYALACEACHGDRTKNRIVRRDVHDALFYSFKPNGNIQFNVTPGQPPKPASVPHPHSEFLNIGFAYMTYLGQRGVVPLFNDSVPFPQYRFRFYTDATRQHPVTDLPPIPVTASGDPNDIVPALDEHGAPITGPALAAQWYSTDPGRALISGDPAEFEAFDVPSLRGIGRSAPYFHDNSHATLADAVDTYSRFILPGTGFTGLVLPVHPPEFPGGPPETLTPTQKQDLVRFLQRL